MLLRTLLLLILPLTVVAADPPSRADLAALKKRIQALSETQNQELRKRDTVQADLRDAELRISRLSKEQRDLDHQVTTSEQRLSRLRSEQAALARDKQAQIDWLVKTVRANYQTGRQERLKLLLNQEQPNQIARLMRYQDYYQRARTERLDAVSSELTELHAISEKIQHTRATLLDQRSQLQQHANQLKAAQQTREQALASLNRSLKDRSTNINQLKNDQQRLQKLLADMQRSLDDIPADPGGKPFGALSGKLPWPVNGRIASGYNSRREGALRWQGVILSAASGTPVRAIHAGRVVYADWLRGYGLLTIVDHGDGYLTLYGHNQSLLREVGEWVATGDPLALSGNTGSHHSSGLYFEIRHRGKAVNPARWCDRRVTLPALANHQH